MDGAARGDAPGGSTALTALAALWHTGTTTRMVVSARPHPAVGWTVRHEPCGPPVPPVGTSRGESGANAERGSAVTHEPALAARIARQNGRTGFRTDPAAHGGRSVRWDGRGDHSASPARPSPGAYPPFPGAIEIRVSQDCEHPPKEGRPTVESTIGRRQPNRRAGGPQSTKTAQSSMTIRSSV